MKRKDGCRGKGEATGYRELQVLCTKKRRRKMGYRYIGKRTGIKVWNIITIYRGIGTE